MLIGEPGRNRPAGGPKDRVSVRANDGHELGDRKARGTARLVKPDAKAVETRQLHACPTGGISQRGFLSGTVPVSGVGLA